jgi:PAS domain S-box-containing protein
MNIFVLSSLLAAGVTTFLGTYALNRNPKGALNRVFFLYCLAGAASSFAEFEYGQAESLATAWFWLRASFLWIFAIPLELHFVMLFTERTKLLERRSTYLLLYIPALVFSGLWLTDWFPLQPVKAYWGWAYLRPERDIFFDSLGIFVGVINLVELFFVAQYYWRETRPKKKRQAGLILAGIIITLVLVLIAEPGMLFTYLNIEFPKLTSIGFIIESALLTYAIWKYELFSLTPAAAATSIIATLTDALFLVNSQGRIATVNQATLELLGYEETELTGQPIEILLIPEEAASFRQRCLEQLLTGESICDSEVTLVTKNARQIPVSLSMSVVRDEDGVEQGVVYVGRDLTERKRTEEQIRASLREKEILLKEIHHRVKNNLQIISSLLMLQCGDGRDGRVRKALEESRNRVYSMAIIHEILYQSKDLAQVDFAEYSQKLINYLLDSYPIDPQAISLKMNVDSLSLSIDTAIYCGLIINELVSNSLKYAFPAGQRGEICIDLQPDTEHQLTLAVSDNGVGLPPDVELHQAESLGLQLVTMLTKQLDGTIELEQNGGTAFKIVFRQSSPIS